MISAVKEKAAKPVASAKNILIEKVDITIMADSEYAIGCASNLSWHPRQNLDLVNAIREEVKHMTRLHFQHVKGHDGEPHNEMVDLVASLQRNQLLCKKEPK